MGGQTSKFYPCCARSVCLHILVASPWLFIAYGIVSHVPENPTKRPVRQRCQQWGLRSFTVYAVVAGFLGRSYRNESCLTYNLALFGTGGKTYLLGRFNKTDSNLAFSSAKTWKNYHDTITQH
ncbi:hypothetical protein K504DRAFT_467354 [Pleomassaria siparia CBS 279.74]|uniref:Uncharacterized protein n=1 Tax=Pleomassaria siparia CBS 279.74 TaxID=1314801 RepID=A0A6G1K9A1_9PLEO|nr:hypothetical protein K504DRAFT_467354 [Pleomassaria siparia CBS 279.74]